MRRVKLEFCGLSEVVGSNGMAVILLSDVGKHRMLSVVCDGIMKYQIGLRCADSKLRLRLLPEVLLDILGDNVEIERFEACIYNLADGEYKTVIRDMYTFKEYPIRLSDAILMSKINGIGLFMEESLFLLQSMPYSDSADRLAIPINTLGTARLENELKKAIDEENYRLASQIQDELNKRRGQEENKPKE